MIQLTAQLWRYSQLQIEVSLLCTWQPNLPKGRLWTSDLCAGLATAERWTIAGLYSLHDHSFLFCSSIFLIFLFGPTVHSTEKEKFGDCWQVAESEQK